MDKFSVTVAVCAHRDIKVRVYENLRGLEECPNPKVRVRPVDGDALITRSRNRAASHFLKTTQDEMLMFIDDDVVISPFDATKLMWLSHQKRYPLLGAAYVTKSKERPGLAIRPLSSGQIKFGVEGGVYPMREISSGCMIIRREILEKFISKGAAEFCEHGGDGYYSFFKNVPVPIDGKLEDASEDWFFCNKARELGFSIWCDTTIKTGHIGPYEYTWDDIVETKNGLRKTYDTAIFNTNSPVKDREAVPS